MSSICHDGQAVCQVPSCGHRAAAARPRWQPPTLARPLLPITSPTMKRQQTAQAMLSCRRAWSLPCPGLGVGGLQRQWRPGAGGAAGAEGSPEPVKRLGAGVTRGGGLCRQHRLVCSPPRSPEAPATARGYAARRAVGHGRNPHSGTSSHGTGGSSRRRRRGAPTGTGAGSGAGARGEVPVGARCCGCGTGHRRGEETCEQGATGAEVPVRGAAVRELARTAHRDGG